jgi:hypothetical protein
MAGDPINTRDQLTGRWPRPGDKMTFLNKNGYDHEREAAAKIFQVGISYDVEDCEVGDTSHTVKFRGYAGRWNGSMFSLDDKRAVGAGRYVTLANGERVAPAGSLILTQDKLRAIVDGAWNAATESQAVPSTDWADRIIDKALSRG